MSDIVGFVVEIWRYPVKSLGGERVESVGCSLRGIVHDRRWALKGADGALGSAKSTRRFRRMPGLLELSSRVGKDGVALIRFTDGSELSATDPGVAARLSATVGEPVVLVEEAGVSHFDDAPLHLVCTETLRQLGAEASPISQWGEPRRFRPNLVLDWNAGADAEGSLVGRRLRIGTALVEVKKRTARCAMVTLAQDELPFTPHLLSHLSETRQSLVGVYARILTPGTIAVGDRVRGG
jgi:uncharacterized protein YcbX